MYKSLEDKKNAVHTILKELEETGENEGMYAFVSYSEKDADKAFDLIEILLRNGVKLHICDDMREKDVQTEVANTNCKCMITLVSKNYINDIDCLLHQYARFSKQVRSNYDRGQQMPCLVIDLENYWCKYKDDIVLKESDCDNETQTTDILDKVAFLKEGLGDLYQLNSGNFAKLINRQANLVLEGDRYEISRQMSFILDYDGHLDNVTNYNDVAQYAGNTVKKLVNQGVDITESIRNKCINYFDEWGKKSYVFSVGVHRATIVCSESEMYIKKGSYIRENPTEERSKNSKLNNLYRKYILNGVLKSSEDIGVLISTENIADEMTLEEVTLFVNGESVENFDKMWINRDTEMKYSDDYKEEGKIYEL